MLHGRRRVLIFRGGIYFVGKDRIKPGLILIMQINQIVKSKIKGVLSETFVVQSKSVQSKMSRLRVTKTTE